MRRTRDVLLTPDEHDDITDALVAMAKELVHLHHTVLERLDHHLLARIDDDDDDDDDDDNYPFQPPDDDPSPDRQRAA